MEFRHFFTKYNKVAGDKLVIQNSISHLSDENQKLQSLLRSYIDGVSVTNRALKEQNNSLVVVNNSIKLANGFASKPPTVLVEASAVLDQSAKQLGLHRG